MTCASKGFLFFEIESFLGWFGDGESSDMFSERRLINAVLGFFELRLEEGGMGRRGLL